MTDLNQHRQSQGISYGQLSHTLGIDKKNLICILKGRTDPRLSTYEAIANAMGYELVLLKRKR
jgi:predicted transcriptional regulator